MPTPIPPTRWLALAALMCGVTHAAAPPGVRRDERGTPLPRGAVARAGVPEWRSPRPILAWEFVPGGKQIATAHGDCLSLWDLRTGSVVRTIHDPAAVAEGRGCFLTRPQFSDDGKLLLSGTDVPDGQGGIKVRLTVWDLVEGSLLGESPRVDATRALAIRPAGRLVACGTLDGQLLLWNPGATNKRALLGGLGTIRAIAFTADGKRLAVLADKLSLVEIETARVVRSVAPGEYVECALSPNGAAAATLGEREGLVWHDLATGKSRSIRDARLGRNNELSFTADGKALADMSSSLMWGQLHFAGVEIERSRRLPLVGTGGWSRQWWHRRKGPPATGALRISPDGKRLAHCESEHLMRVWEVATGRPLGGFLNPAVAVAFSPDGRELRTLNEVGPPVDLVRWDAVTGRETARRRIDRTALDDSGNPLIYPLGDWRRHFYRASRQAAATIDLDSGKGHRFEAGSSSVEAWGVSPDGRTFAFADFDRNVWIWNTATGARLGRFDLSAHAEHVSWLTYTPDGRTMLTGDGTRLLHLWDAGNGKHCATHRRDGPRGRRVQRHEAYHTAMTSDGRMLVVSLGDQLVVWDIVAGVELGPLDQPFARQHPSNEGSVSFSPDDRFLARLDSAGLTLYEVASARVVHRLQGDFGCLAFSPTARRLATGHNPDASVLVWDLPSLVLGSSLPPADAESLWAELSHDDAARAYRAVWHLADLPSGVALLSRHLTPVQPLPAGRARQLVNDLASDNFETRRAAEKALLEAREAAIEAMSETRRTTTDLEQRSRLDRLIAALARPTPARLRESRAVLALEARATPEARRLLTRLAAGVPGAQLTRQAKATLTRLARQP